MDSSAHKKAPHRHKGRFYNHQGECKPHIFMPSLSMLIECYWNTTKKKSVDTHYWVTETAQEPVHKQLQPDSFSLTWIGHSTFLIQAQGVSILTDPVFGHLPLFKRQLPVGMPLEEVPPIDYILISHNHRDHMDEPSLRFFKKCEHTHFLVPHGDKAWFVKRGFKNVTEYMWWDQKVVTHHGFPLSFTFLPALHWSQRGVFDFNKSLWGSWMISIAGKNLYFAGDTAYSHHFSDIAKEFNDISLALMPIGPCEPRKWMSYAHVSAEEAGQGFLDLNAKHFIPMHWGTFSFGTDPHAGPVDRLTHWWRQQNLNLIDKQLTVLKVGQRLHPEENNQPIHAPSAELITELSS